MTVAQQLLVRLQKIQEMCNISDKEIADSLDEDSPAPVVVPSEDPNCEDDENDDDYDDDEDDEDDE